METEATTAIGDIRGERATRRAGPIALMRAHLLWQIRYFVEHSDWEEVMIAQDEWIDRVCIGVIIVASLYFVPPLLMILF
jgi:hypothetical protein